MLKPLGDRVVIRVLEQEEKTASGIFLPDTAKEKPSATSWLSSNKSFLIKLKNT